MEGAEQSTLLKEICKITSSPPKRESTDGERNRSMSESPSKKTKKADRTSAQYTAADELCFIELFESSMGVKALMDHFPGHTRSSVRFLKDRMFADWKAKPLAKLKAEEK